MGLFTRRSISESTAVPLGSRSAIVYDQPPEMWELPDECVPIALGILARAGCDFTAPDIGQAIANLHPPKLSDSVLELLSAVDRATYDFEQKALNSPGWQAYDQ